MQEIEVAGIKFSGLNVDLARVSITGNLFLTMKAGVFGSLSRILPR